VPYGCQLCGGGGADGWWPQCPDCGEYGGCVTERATPPATEPAAGPDYKSRSVRIVDLAEELVHHPTGLEVIDRALGGGLVWGYTVLMSGAPGAGKTTLALALADAFAGPALFASGEENKQQVGQTVTRLGIASEALRFMESDDLAEILEEAEQLTPRLLVINSINTTSEGSGARGTSAQVGVMRRVVEWTLPRELMTVFTGHITWRGHSAGPRALEHDAGAVLYVRVDNGRRLLEVRKSRIGPCPQLLDIPHLGRKML
jgi:DNA repair protein RadA/Sms